MRDNASIPMAGDFVEVRTRRWAVDGIAGGESLVRARLACIDDDAQGEMLEVLWRDEVDASVIADSHLSVFEKPWTDDPTVFSADPLEHGDRGRPKAAPGAVQSWHPS
jgi:hypothetical protein